MRRRGSWGDVVEAIRFTPLGLAEAVKPLPDVDAAKEPFPAPTRRGQLDLNRPGFDGGSLGWVSHAASG